MPVALPAARLPTQRCRPIAHLLDSVSDFYRSANRLEGVRSEPESQLDRPVDGKVAITERRGCVVNQRMSRTLRAGVIVVDVVSAKSSHSSHSWQAQRRGSDTPVRGRIKSLVTKLEAAESALVIWGVSGY